MGHRFFLFFCIFYFAQFTAIQTVDAKVHHREGENPKPHETPATVITTSCEKTLLEGQPSLAPLEVPIANDPFLSQVVNSLLAAFPPDSGVDAEKIHNLLSVPPRMELGQWAFPCFTLAKAFRTAPPKIAQTLKETISKNLPPLIAKVEVVGAYLNFYVDFDAYGKWLIDQVKTGALFVNRFESPEKAEKINIEFSQPNTHKALHVGHLRNMVFGESVSRLLEGAGHQVVRSTYPGDLGAHIAKVLWYIQTQKGAVLPTTDQANWLGKMYAEADAYEKAHEGESTKAEIDTVLKHIHNREEPMYSLYQTTREWSLSEMRRIYDWLGIRFDQWFFEGECDEPSQMLVQQKLAEGFFVKSEGAVGIDLTPHGIPSFAMVLTSSGNGLYLTKDLELVRRKFEDPAVTRSLVVVDDRQRLHFKQVFKISELMGFEQARKSIHLAYATVNAADGSAFSSRTLNGVGLDEIRKAAEEGVAEELKHRLGGSVSDEQMQTLIRKFALGTIKFGMLRVDAETSIRFDLADWLRTDGDTGFSVLSLYLQLKKEAGGEQGDANAFEAKTESERRLLQHLARFPFVKLDAAQKTKPAFVTAYLLDLKKEVAAFQAERNTPAASSPESQKLLLGATAEIMRQAFLLLGIDI